MFVVASEYAWCEAVCVNVRVKGQVVLLQVLLHVLPCSDRLSSPRCCPGRVMDCSGRVMLTKHPLWWALDEWLACSRSPWAACLVVIMTLESSLPLPSLGPFHSSSPHNVTTDTIQRERSTYLEKREIKDTSFLTHHFHISQTSIGLWRVDSHSGRDENENQLVVMSRSWKYPDCSHGRDGERGCSCFLERTEAWVHPPRRALLGRVPYTTGSAPFCFLAPVHVTVENSQEHTPCWPLYAA